MAMKKLKILITGGAGFLGLNLALAAAADHDVCLLDNLRRTPIGDLRRAKQNGIELVQGDVLDRSPLTELVRDADIVVHMAAIAGVLNYYKAPYDVLRVNIGGTMNLIESLTEKTRRLIFISSSEVYGTNAGNAHEDQSLTVDDMKEPRWTYAVSKIAGEKLCLTAGAQKGLEVVCLRPFNIYGPGQSGNGAVRDMTLAALAGEDIVVHGDGEQVRAWCFVDDFIAATMAAIRQEGVGDEIINIGNATGAATARRLAELIVVATGSKSRITHKAHFGTDILLRTPDIAKAKDLLGFSAKIDLEAGLKITADWYREHGRT
jgi:nucleoside-diphosphate-sugar epimerase